MSDSNSRENATPENTAQKIQKKLEKSLTISNELFTDISAEGQMYGFLIRSPKKSGKLVSVDFAGDVNTDEKSKCMIIGAKEIKGEKSVEMLALSTEIFCTGKIKYEGEPVALLLSEDERLAKRFIATGKIKIDIEEDENSDANENANSAGKKEIARREIKSDEYSKSVFENADFVVEGRWRNTMKGSSDKEPNGALAIPSDGKILLRTPSHWSSNLQKSVSRATGIPKSDIYINITNITVNNTNAIRQNEMAAVQAAIAAQISGKPVKIVYSRSEQEKFIENPAEIVIKHKTALDKNGNILLMKVEIEADVGESNPFAEEIAERLLISATGIYKPKDYSVTVSVKSSYEPPKAVKLSSIAMHTFFALENQMNKIADTACITPAKLRRINANKNLPILGNMNFDSVISLATKDLDRYIRSERKDAAKADESKTTVEVPDDFEPSIFERKYVAYRQKSKTTTIADTIPPYVQNPRGIALACAVEGNGYLKRKISLKTEMRPDGKFAIDSFAKNAWSKWAKTVSDMLKIDKKDVFLSPTIETSEENDWPDTLSDNVSVKTELLKKCCSLTLEGNSKPESFVSDLEGYDERKKFYSSTLAACVMEVDVDPCNMDVSIRKMNVAIDCGKIEDTDGMTNTVLLEIQKIISQLESDGTIKCGEIEVRFADEKNAPASRAREINHIMYSVVPAAFTSALSLALAHTVENLPTTKEGLYNACKIQPQ